MIIFARNIGNTICIAMKYLTGYWTQPDAANDNIIRL